MHEIEALTEQERAVLEFESQPWPSRDEKAAAIKAAFGWSATQHAQYVLHVSQLPQALVEFPVLVHRLERLRQSRRAARTRSTRQVA